MRAHRLVAAATAGSLLLTLIPGAVAGTASRIMLITGDLVSTRSGSAIPPAAAPYVAGGRLDKALFDARTLIDEGAGSEPPIIVSYAGSPAIATHRARHHNPAGKPHRPHPRYADRRHSPLVTLFGWSSP